ncbi:MAG: sterol desaturase family protein [Gammaproteobacteria bacterium]|nr:MAG: sterol desaturase family protein [Gammaproteobacteria bacterium]
MAQARSEESAGASLVAMLAAMLGVLSLLGVLCFHFPELLTSQAFREVYTEPLARTLLLVGLVAAFILGTWSLLRGRGRRLSLLAVGSAALALLLGGASVDFDPIQPTPFSLGLDWFIISLLVSALVFVPIERMASAREQAILRPEWRTDLAYFFVGHLLIQFILISVTTFTGLVLAFALYPPLQTWVQLWPLWVQFLVAVFVADLAQASLHRAYHSVPLLWRFHAVHHSCRHLDWIAGSRMHLLEILATRALVLLALLWVGFAPAAINAYVILVGLQAVLAHANLGLRFGWLEYVLVLPRYHHWHHARDPAYAHCNFAIHLPLVDMLLGTFKLPKQGWPAEYGLHDPDSMPVGILWQHVAPFRFRRRPTLRGGA